MERDNKGRFVKGNKIRRKPLLCPNCGYPIDIGVYIKIKNKTEQDGKETG